MEYGDAINPDALDSAVDTTRRLLAGRSDPLDELAAEAVQVTFCTCVTEAEDVVEHQLSDVHRQVIEEVVARVRMLESTLPRSA